MSRGTNDLAKLASLLMADPTDVLKALGGPWFEDSQFARDLRWDLDPAPLEDDALVGDYARQFLGRVGPSVVLRIDSAHRRLLVGMGVGRWDGPGTLVWEAAEPVRTLDIPLTRGPAEIERFFREAGAAVDEAAFAKAPTLVTCRYCGAVIAPEHALDRNTCYGCGRNYTESATEARVARPDQSTVALARAVRSPSRMAAWAATSDSL